MLKEIFSFSRNNITVQTFEICLALQIFHINCLHWRNGKWHLYFFSSRRTWKIQFNVICIKLTRRTFISRYTNIQGLIYRLTRKTSFKSAWFDILFFTNVVRLGCNGSVWKGSTWRSFYYYVFSDSAMAFWFP